MAIVVGYRKDQPSLFSGPVGVLVQRDRDIEIIRLFHIDHPGITHDLARGQDHVGVDLKGAEKVWTKRDRLGCATIFYVEGSGEDGASVPDQIKVDGTG